MKYAADRIALAIGFDAMTGPLPQIDITADRCSPPSRQNGRRASCTCKQRDWSNLVTVTGHGQLVRDQQHGGVDSPD
jgi:hypothetical protein